MEEVRFLIDNGFYKEPVPTEDYPEVTETHFRTEIPKPGSEVVSQVQIKSTQRSKRIISTNQSHIQRRK